MKKQQVKLLSFLFAGLFILAGLNVAAQGSKGNKNIVKEERSVGSFTGIEVGGAFNVFLTQTEKTSLMIEADENLIGSITTEVSKGILKIGSRNIRNATKLNIYVSIPTIQSLDISGAVTIKSENTLQAEAFRVDASGASHADLDLSVTDLDIDASGASHVNLAGFADNQKIDASGAAGVDASGLETKVTRAEASGAANITVNATEKVERQTSGAGSIKIVGEAKSADTDSSGKPSVIVVKTNDNRGYRSGDTTTVKVGSVIVEVVDGDSTKVTVGNHALVVDEKGNVKWEKNKKHKFNGHWAGVDIGINGYLNEDFSTEIPDAYSFLDLKYEKSADVNINVYEQNFNLANNKLGLITGIGLRWNNYRFADNVVLVPDTTPVYGYRDYNHDYQKSKLVVNYLTVPLLLEYQTNRFSRSNSFHITGGMVLGWRYASHTKMLYFEDGRRKPKAQDNFEINPFRYDATVRIGWGIINLYATYSLNKMFENGGGPELYPMAVGITLAGW